ncbi:hypothetical protein quinque_009957 [Culex quinquefasciatus]
MNAKRTKIPPAIKQIILDLKKDKKSLAEIATIVKRPKSSVQYVIHNYKTSGSLEITPGRGPKPKLTERHHRLILREIKINPRLSAPKLADSLYQNTGVRVNPQTIRNVIRSKGYRGCVARKKPFISAINKNKRLLYAKKYVSKPKEFWRDVMFTDESKYNLFGSDGIVRVWRKPNTELDPKNVRPTVKHGGGHVMVWGAFTANENLKQSAEKLGHGSDFRLVHDNDPKHNSFLVKEWLLYNVKSTLPHPPQSPDLNPIENLWDHLDRKVREHKIRNKEHLKRILKQEWDQIPPEVTQKLAFSMPKRLQSVVAAKGGHTKY